MFDELKNLVMTNRSYRRFDNTVKISDDTVKALIELARNTPSAANRQPLRYAYSVESELNEKIYTTLKWAGYLSDWDGPENNERPTAYIILLTPNDITTASMHDEGIVCQTILLGARALGLGGCILGNVDRASLKNIMNIPDEYSIKLVIALGKPVENIVLKDISSGDDIKYYRDENKTHYVPKIKLDDIILK